MKISIILIVYFTSEPISVVRDGRYVVRGHVVEVKDGKQMPYSSPQATERLQQGGPEVWRTELPDNYDLQSRYKDLSNNHTNSGILYAMNEDRLYSMQPAFDPAYAVPSSDGKIGDRIENGLVPDTWTMAQQEKLRADAIAKSGPKLAFINDESQKEPPEGALPCIMGRDSPGGSITSLDSLDEIPQAAGPGKGQDSGAFSRSGIIGRGGKETKSAGKRRVTFSDSIEFDDGVTGQLVTEEKQSTKVYTMLYARNVNNYYNMLSSGSSSITGHSGMSQKGNKSTVLTSASQMGTEQSGSSSASSVVKASVKETSVATVIHCDHPRAKPVPLDSPPTQPEKVLVSSNQENRVKESGEPKDETDVVSDAELNDSLEVVKDSLDGEDDRIKNVRPKDQDDLPYDESSAVNWTATVSPSVVKDSLERYVQSTAEISAEEPIEKFPSSDGGLEEREPVYSKPGYTTVPSVVTSGYQYRNTLNTSAVQAATTSPHVYHHSTQVYSGMHVPSQGTFHPHFPYPFYTSAGSALMRVGAARQEPQQIETSSIPLTSHFATTNYRPEGREVAYPSGPQEIPAPEAVSSSSTVNAGHTFNSHTTAITGVKDGGSRWVETKNETNKAVSSRQKLTSSPSSTASTASSTTTSRSTRSLIPRPPTTKKSGKSRFHPGGLNRKQISDRPRKANYNQSAVSDNGRSVKTAKASTNNRNSQTEHVVERQNSDSKRTESTRNGTGRIHSKRANSSEKNNSADHDGIIESIKRNMEMMSMRTRTTAAEEQHQRILNSLRLEFGDGRKTQQEPAVYGGTGGEGGNAAEHHVKTQDTASRRVHVHHLRVGSAGSRSGRPPAGISVKLDLVDDGNYQAGFDGYPNRDKPLEKKTIQRVPGDGARGVVQKSPYDPVMNQQFDYNDRRHEYPTSTVGHPTNATTTSQERERPLQARASTLYEREDSDLKRSISLDKTPTDDEINHLWAHVRSYLHGGNTKSVGSDSCVNRVDVRRSRTRSSSMQQVYNPRAAVPQQNSPGSQLLNGQHFGVPPQTGGSTLGGLRRYGSHEVLRRDSSSDSLSFKRSPLLQQRASRSRRPQKHPHGQNGRPPLPRQHEYNPSPSQAGPSASVSSRGWCVRGVFLFFVRFPLRSFSLFVNLFLASLSDYYRNSFFSPRM